MALHPDFPKNPYQILDPKIRWFPADEALREQRYDHLMPPLVDSLRKKVKGWRDLNYKGATETSRYLLNWWFNTEHLIPTNDGSAISFQYYFAQREGIETIIYLHDVVKARDKYDLLRFDSHGSVSAGMFDETWQRCVVKMATGSGKTKLLSLVRHGRISINSMRRIQHWQEIFWLSLPILLYLTGYVMILMA